MGIFMENGDARTLSQDAQEEMRRQAVRALKKQDTNAGRRGLRHTTIDKE